MIETHWRRLLHRWFVEYNPLYLLSAALVLVGVDLIARDLARLGDAYAQLGVAAIAELYAWALIGGAALLTRINLRRPAVMLSLLTALYQCDVTLHTETCVYLGGAGALGSTLWLASFVGKLYALAWAVRLRLARSAVVIPTVGALGLAILPALLGALDGPMATALVGSWVFATLSSALWSVRRVSSRVALDEWGATVLRRALNATWLLWATLLLAHVFFWWTEHRFQIGVLVPVAMLLSTRWLSREAAVWCVAAGTLIFVGLALPSVLSITALMAAVVLLLRAFRNPACRAPDDEPPAASTPYRMPGAAARRVRAVFEPSFAFASPDAMLRLLSGSLIGAYLAVWTLGWSGGPWPDHLLGLDLALTVAVLVIAQRTRAFAVLVAPAATWLHFCVQTGLLTAPQTTLAWGALAVGLGFALLVVSLLTSWRFRARDPVVPH